MRFAILVTVAALLGRAHTAWKEKLGDDPIFPSTLDPI